MPICLPILIEILRETSNFLCNCRCEIGDDTEFFRPRTPIGVKLLVELLCERPEFVCYCTGCEAISHDAGSQDIDTMCGHNSKPVEKRFLICLNILIENLRNQPNFSCNCQCREFAADLIESLTEPRVKLVVKLLCERPENLCFCSGCEVHMRESDEIIIQINDEAVTNQCSRISTIRGRITSTMWKLRWIFMVLTVIAVFFIFIKNNIETTESNGVLSTTQSAPTPTTHSTTTPTTHTTNDDGIWNPI